MATTISKDSITSLVGSSLEASPWFQVKQDQINAFADTTLDHQFIHVDPERAAGTPFGATIAHGFLTLSMLSHFAESFGVVIDGVQMGINYGFDKVRFLNPVTVDSEVRAVAEVMDVTEKNPGQFMIKYQVTVEIKGSDKPALMAEWLTLQIVA
ncbi:MAG: MaoC family dehydratase [Candidatus Pelagadaptatus aseana]|uniref:MaoC family dehydratase n=1 Tax=Candidatus Pelagadaptatus aseana TaxID=3120508 RepID=UPI0039B2DA6C